MQIATVVGNSYQNNTLDGSQVLQYYHRHSLLSPHHILFSPPVAASVAIVTLSH